MPPRPSNIDPIRARWLFMSVIRRALLDALGDDSLDRDVKTRSTLLREDSRARIAAHKWLSRGGPDYREVCDLAGVPAAELRDAYVNGRIDVQRLRSLPSDSTTEGLLT